MTVSDMKDVLSRFQEDYIASIDCDEGWNHLILACHKELHRLDPNYTIFQIKEKFGELRYYATPSNPQLNKEFHEIVDKYTRISRQTCEISGKHGQLMRTKSGWYKTLHTDHLPEGNEWHLAEIPTLQPVEPEEPKEYDLGGLSVEGTLRLIALMLAEGHDKVAVNLAPEFLLEAADTITGLRQQVADLEQELLTETHLKGMNGA